MDKFTKTTEVDLSNVNMIEEETPQKSKWGKVIAIIVSLVLAVSAWLYAMETDTTTFEKVYDDIDVVVVGKSEKFNISANKVSVTLVGTNSQLVDVDPSKIVVKVDPMKQYKNDSGYKFYAYSDMIYYDGDIDVSVKEKSVKILITLEENIGK